MNLVFILKLLAFTDSSVPIVVSISIKEKENMLCILSFQLQFVQLLK